MVVPGSERGDADPSWSPDGAQLVFDSLRNELVPDGYARPEIYVADFDGVNLHPITYSTPDQLYTDVQIRSNYGRLIKSLLVLGDPIGVALDGRILAVLTHPAHSQADELYVYRDGLLAHLTVPGTSSSLAASGGRIVFAAGNTIRLVEPRTGTIRLLAFTRGELIGVGISGRRVTWAENVRKRGLIRTLVLR
jgi:dipeptidyl aminopeptidase/acylaminoacyl peptidase